MQLYYIKQSHKICYNHSRYLIQFDIPLWGIVDVWKSVYVHFIYPEEKKTILYQKIKFYKKYICIYIKYIFVKYIFKHFKICKINIWN